MTVVLTRDYAKNVVARAVPGAYFDRDTKAFVLKDPTPRAAAVALRLFPDVATAHPELVELRASLAQEVRPFDNASAYGKPVGAPRVRALLGAL